MQGPDSYFIATHTDKKDPQNIKSQPQNDNTQSDPESNLFSNLRKRICKLEAQLSAIKSYVNCEVSILINKIESISNDFGKSINILQGK